ncbi:hypothetical protein BG000_003785 [Podila horticola]|nr:hypothetical protein BG000_003785 [Podila horticola]
MVRPRVDSVYDESSYFDQAGLPMTPPDQRVDPDMARLLSDWKHQRISHPVVKQALMRDRAGYITFRHSRSPSLATIPENQLLEDQIYVRVPESTDMGGENEAGGIEEEFEDHVLVELELDSEVACALAHRTNQERLRTKTEAVIQSGCIQPQCQPLGEVIQILEVQDGGSDEEEEQEKDQVRMDCSFEESDMDCDTDGAASTSQFQTTSTSTLSSSSQSIYRRPLTQFSGPPPPSVLAISSVRTTPPSSIPAFIRPRTISTTSTATNSSVSTVKPNKSLERMLMMMRRTDKTASDLQQHSEYLGDEDEEDEEGYDVYSEDAYRDIASGDDKEEGEEEEHDDDDRSIIRQPCPREPRLQLRRQNASMDQLERSPQGQVPAQGRRFSLQYDLRGMLRGRRSSRDGSCENLYPEEGMSSSSRRLSLASVSSSIGEGGSRGSRKSAILPIGGGSGGGDKVKGVLKWIREWPPRLKRRVSVSGMKDSG